MEIVTKPFEAKYREGVVDVLQYLWHEELDERFAHFDWLYFGNPSHPDPLAVVAVNENDEVMGFRGWVPGIIKTDGNAYLVARAADVVVSPKARRQGVFSKMTVYSLSYLKDNGVQAILNLSSNSQSNPGYRKLGWVTMAHKNIWYQLLPPLLTSKKNTLKDKIQLKLGSQTVFLYPYIPRGLKIPTSNDLSFSMEDGQLDWFSMRPYTKYVTLTAYNTNEDLEALFIIDIEGQMSRLLFFYCKDISKSKKYFKILKPYIEKRIISAWGWALSEKNRLLLKKMGFICIPFYEKLRKKPPILVRSIGDTEVTDNWIIERKDIRDRKNWNINLIDDF